MKPKDGIVHIDAGVLGDRPRTLRLMLSDLKAMRKETGKGITEWIPRLAQLDEETIVTLLYYGLRRDDAELTPDSVECMVHMGNLHYLMEKLCLAVGVEKEESKADGPSPLLQ